MAKNFYKDLYDVKSISDAKYELLHQLDLINSKSLEGSATKEEILKIIKVWPLKSVSGSDRLSYELFKTLLKNKLLEGTFLDLLQIMIIILMDPNIYGCKIASDWTEECIKIMFKKDKFTDIKNYYPLSMTNTIYKLLTTVINDRLASVCIKIIGPH